MEDDRKIAIHAPAKVNLFLHVVGKRADGYHFLDSLVAFTEYGDLIEVEESDSLSLAIDGSFAALLKDTELEKNLVWKAAILLQGQLPKQRGAKIILTKNLPVAAGIGGGSADAAATIKALVKLWELDISQNELERITLKLGSDVPVCLYGQTSLMRGIGDKITPVKLNDSAFIVMVCPDIPLATADVFRSFIFNQPRKLVDNIDSLREITNEAGYANDLESTAIRKLPMIGDLIESLQATDGCFVARMSGSGATCFGLYYDKTKAENAAAELQKTYKQAWCVATHIL